VSGGGTPNLQRESPNVRAVSLLSCLCRRSGGIATPCTWQSVMTWQTEFQALVGKCYQTADEKSMREALSRRQPLKKVGEI
jgi:hypothetical protein